ncbi:MAG TPA: 3-keto-5-aminohexanoate cleavage protein, partial [Acidimicrobiia bacterium]|nr:3-keto-5-aminohexanoate cleavage protein [Acidimicrobiia bacterium]
YEETWRAILAAEPDVMLYPTMRGWGPDTTIEQRYSHVVALAGAGVLGTTIVDLGPINVAPVGADGLPEAVDVMYLCTFGDIDYEFRAARDIGLPISLAVFEPGHLRAGLAYVKNGFAPPGSMIKFFFESAPIGVAARGLPPTRSALGAYLDMLDGFDLPWMAAVTGAPALDPAFHRLVLESGGHLSVGIERTGRGGTPRNVDLVAQAAELCHACGRPPLTPAETRRALGLDAALR